MSHKSNNNAIETLILSHANVSVRYTQVRQNIFLSKKKTLSTKSEGLKLQRFRGSKD